MATQYVKQGTREPNLVVAVVHVDGLIYVSELRAPTGLLIISQVII
jgi:hypothetical protein